MAAPTIPMLFDLMVPAVKSASEDNVPALQPDEQLSQWFTPEWAAIALVERYFPSLDRSDLVVEPSCGPGAFLKAIPDHVPALGVEIDLVVAQCARENTGREIITGDFVSVELPQGITAMIGNPPFKLSLFERFLNRAHRVLPELSRCGFLVRHTSSRPTEESTSGATAGACAWT